MNATDERSVELREHIERIQEAIVAFERMAAHLRERRRIAAEPVTAELDERLEVNARTREALKRSLELAQLEIAHASRSAPVVRSSQDPARDVRPTATEFPDRAGHAP